MVLHDMQATKAHLASERIRLSLGLLTPAEKAAEEKRATEKAEQDAKAATKGISLFDRD